MRSRRRRSIRRLRGMTPDAQDQHLLRDRDPHVLERARPPDRPLPSEYDGRSASVAIDGTVLAGYLPPRAVRLVRRWAHLHQEELLANWRRARQHQPVARSTLFPNIESWWQYPHWSTSQASK
ncbi:MAG: DUF4160 domain-containing protein [Solirubrobacterales bacterium]